MAQSAASWAIRPPKGATVPLSPPLLPLRAIEPRTPTSAGIRWPLPKAAPEQICHLSHMCTYVPIALYPEPRILILVDLVLVAGYLDRSDLPKWHMRAATVIVCSALEK